MTPTLHTDGGARGNPGPAGIGAILKDGPRVLGEVAMSVGVATNNVAEYKAVITGLELALEQGVRELEVYMDSQLVVSQLKGEWKIKNADLKPLALRARSLMNRFDRISLSHVPRELNHEADRLANQAMDQAALDMAQDEESRAALGQEVAARVILWHMGLATLIVYMTLGRRRIDFRFILLGAVLPDLLDPVIRAMGGFEGDRGPTHSLAAVVVVAVVIILGLRGETRLAVFGVAVGWLLHLVGDGMWEAPRTFLWPAFGTSFDPLSAEPYSWSLLTRPWEHLGTWAGELVGLGILAWFWVAFRLGEEGRAVLFARDGYLRP